MHTGGMPWDHGDTTSQKMTKIASRPPKPREEAWQRFFTVLSKWQPH